MTALDRPAVADPIPPGYPRKPRGPNESRILFVEDDEDFASCFAEMFRMDGHDVRLARDAIEALDAVGYCRPDVIILDIGLPGMSGLELAEELRRHPAARGAFLIALTGFDGPDERRAARDAGLDAYLTKPVLFGEVRNLLAGHLAAALRDRGRPVACAAHTVAGKAP
jgi:two-component system, OmpR family, response regulator